ncbi:MAG: S8 family serine peptidase [Bacteroidetes bacterium]|nr:S8 family serine peptidase [Bacteroidota bacterium]MDE2672660.1 S8 family serine peptidase [Bacteroidota bacterium]
MITRLLTWGLQARLFFWFLLWVFIVIWAVPSGLAQEQPIYEPQVVVVQVEPGLAIVEGAGKTGLEVFDRTAAEYSVHTIERVFPFLDHVQPTPKTRRNLVALRHTYYVRYSAGDDPERVAEVLASAPGVIYAEPVIVNRLLYSEVTAEPDDSLFSDQTYLRHMRLPEAWNIVKGEYMSPPVVIAIVDDGTDWRHEDLLANVWTNANEIPDNGIDDDNNGLIDDVHGANFCNRDDTNNDPFHPGGSGHGTRVAGTAGAVTNNGIGVAGSAWNAQHMHICGDGFKGILYAAANGADIINASWGGPGLLASTFNAQSLDLATDMGALVVAAAGNDNLNNDLYPFYPSSYPRVLSVGATAKDSRRRASFSNYGKMVNVFVPGVSIVTTDLDGEYLSSASGTSFSSPLVSGVAALVKTRYPDISPDALREQIRLASEHIDAENPSHAGQLGRGYVNAEASLEMPVFPAVRLMRWTWDDSDSDLMIMSGEEVTIQAVFVNHLADAQELSIGLTGAESYPYLDLSNAEQTVGRLARGDSTEVTLRFVVASDAPSSRLIRLYTRIRDGAFVDEPDQLSFGINSRIELDHAALSALFTSTGGASWRNNRNWDITTVPTPSELARWYGVEASHGILSRLNLYRNHLTGTLPSELGDLQGLEDLRLYKNSITGEIPHELGNLTQLQWLDISTNSLSGEIPPELGNLTQLQRLDMSTNSLSGEIPPELGSLTRLQALVLNANVLTGKIPNELGNFTQLQRLDLGDNSLSGEVPGELGNLSQLTQLYLHDNAFTGRLPRSLTQLTNLKALHFSGQDLCAPGDFAFRVWLSTIPDVSGPTCSGAHFIDRAADQSFPRAQPIVPVVLPEAAGALPINYRLTPTLPTGLAFDQANRTLSGLPTVVTPATPYTYKATDAKGSTDSLSFTIEVYSPVGVERGSLPEAFALHGNFPNPFRHTTQLLMDLPWPARVTVEVVDVIGRRILTTPSTDLTAGWQRSVNLSMAVLPSGLYLYRVHASSPGGRVVHAGRFVHVR